ncbi:MAG TPA: MFS transporter [Thermoleophilaceae bacterium]|nr:MFS transporter [Thermoleophilaceae bacterium]
MNSNQPYSNRWKALAVLALSLLIVSLDNTILNTAIPSLRDDLSASGSALQWIVDSYLLVFAGLLLTAGSLGDRFGRKRALQFGLLVFAVGSAASALATSSEMLTATRALMGVGGAFIMPSTLSIITAIFPAEERGKAIGAWAAVSGLGIVLGPVAGGALLEAFDWSAVFWVNVPIAALAIVAGMRLIPESRDPRARPLDLRGAALSMAGLTAVVWSIIEAPERGWTSPAVLAATAGGVVVLAGFARWERRARYPMLDLALFRDLRFSAASITISLLFAALLGTVFILTQHLQSVLDYDALGAGLRITPLGAGVIVASAASARLTDRVGTKIMVAGGMSVIAAGLGALSLVTVDSGYGLIAATLVTMGAGIGMTMAPATDAIMGSVPISHAGIGSAMNDTTRMVGGALGVAVLGSVLSHGYRDGVEETLDGLPPDAAAAADSSIGGAVSVADRMGPAGDALRGAADAAFVTGMADAALVAGGVVLAGAVIAALWLPARAGAAEPAPDATGAQPAAA